jgi:ferredoxin
VNADHRQEPVDAADAITVTVTLGGQTVDVEQRRGLTVLESARWAGLRLPSSCELGGCGSCIARVVQGRVEMYRNEVLTSEEVEDGWILACQAIPTTPTVHVVYES